MSLNDFSPTIQTADNSSKIYNPENLFEIIRNLTESVNPVLSDHSNRLNKDLNDKW